MKKVLILLFSCLPGILFAQGFAPPVSQNISSDYGSRNLTVYDWHYGIDYSTPMWTPVEAVEGGNITRINFELGGAGWYIRVHGDSAYWTYMHLFQDGDPSLSPDNRYEVRMGILENPNNPQDILNRYIFIFWIDRNNNRAEKVLVPYDARDRCIRWGDDYIRDQNGELILTRGNVADREIIAPSGESGVGPEHLHVSAKSADGGRPYDINPLYYIIHPQPEYTVNIHHPPVDALLYHRPGAPEAQQLNERISVNINSTQGLDLDRGFVYFFKLGEPRVFDDAHRYAKITYGGPPSNIPFPEPFPNRITIDGEANRGALTRSGLDPQGNVPGNADFYFVFVLHAPKSF